MNFFKGFWQFFVGDEDQARLTAKRTKSGQLNVQTETENAEPDDEQCCDDYFEDDELMD